MRASTPFATSEVVIATNSGYYNVIIKGIETTSVAAVTDLVRDLDDPKAVERMEPLIVDDRDLVVPQGGPPESSLDPAPDDLPDGGDPIDFSGDDEPSAEAAKPDRDALPIDGLPFDEPLRRPAQKAAAIDEDADHFGGDATTLLGVEPPIVSLDPVPNDFPDDDMEPVDLDVSVTSSTPSRRTQTLHGVLVGRQLAKQIHLQTGQEVRLISPISDPSNPDATGSPIPYNRDYRVAGEFFTGMYEYDLKYVYVTLESLQSFLDRGDSIDGIEVRVPDPDGTGAVVAALQRELGPNYRVQDWRELNRNLFSALKLEKIAMFMVLGIIILVASFSIVGNLIMVVVEKGRQIALLKTLGSATFDVVVIFILQGMFIGVIGTLLGVTSGLGVCWYLSSHGFPINPDVYYIDKLPVHVDYGSVALIGVAGFVISVAATLYPAFLASRLRPAAGLRT